jgi:hypothetical protein
MPRWLSVWFDYRGQHQGLFARHSDADIKLSALLLIAQNLMRPVLLM